MPYILGRIGNLGPAVALPVPKPEAGVQSAWADRAMTAHSNAVANLVLLAPAVSMAHQFGISTPATRMAAPAYFFARLVHYSRPIPRLYYWLGRDACVPAKRLALDVTAARDNAVVDWVKSFRPTRNFLRSARHIGSRRNSMTQLIC